MRVFVTEVLDVVASVL